MMEIYQYLIAHPAPISSLIALLLLERVWRLRNDLRQHRLDESRWRDEMLFYQSHHDEWRVAHLTAHAPSSTIGKEAE